LQIQAESSSMKNTCVTLIAAMLPSQLVFAGPVYDNYSAYYQSMNGIFRDKASFRIQGSRNAVVYWQNQRLELKRATAFPREVTVNDDLGPRAVAFEKFPYACVEGQSSSASGTADRYRSTYLLDASTKGKVEVYKLPSLFGSCKAVRLDEHGRPLFHDADYIYANGSDDPVGLTLREYVISRGQFVPTGHSVTTRFVEPENVWKFEVVAVK
jgi:hypothetical protein